MRIRTLRIVLTVETDGHLRDLKEKGLWDWAGEQRWFRVKDAEVVLPHPVEVPHLQPCPV